MKVFVVLDNSVLDCDTDAVVVGVCTNIEDAREKLSNYRKLYYNLKDDWAADASDLDEWVDEPDEFNIWVEGSSVWIRIIENTLE